MAQPRLCFDKSPKMVGLVNALVLSFMCPCDVPAQTKARLGKVSVGTEANHWSQTAKPLARPDRMGSIAGVNIPMMSAATVPGSIGHVGSFASHPRVYAKLVTN